MVRARAHRLVCADKLATPHANEKANSVRQLRFLLAANCVVVDGVAALIRT